jgi:hypothetical protein
VGGLKNPPFFSTFNYERKAMDWFTTNFISVKSLEGGSWGGFSISADWKNLTMLVLFLIALPKLIQASRWAFNGVKAYFGSFKAKEQEAR